MEINHGQQIKNLTCLDSSIKKNCLFLAMLVFLLRTGFSSWGEQGLLSGCIRRLLVAAASLVAEHRL